MPYPNWHAGRVRDPDGFMKDTFRNITLKGVKGVEIITGKLKKDGPMVTQAYRLSSKEFTEKQAKDWLKNHKVTTILFEPASIKEETMSMAANVGPPSFDKAWEKMKKKKKDMPMGMMSEQEIVATTEGDVYYPFVGSFEETTKNVREALKETTMYGDWQFILATFDDRVYFEIHDSMQSKTRYFEAEYSQDADGDVTIGKVNEMTKKTDWIIKEQAEAIARHLFRIEEDLLTEEMYG